MKRKLTLILFACLTLLIFTVLFTACDFGIDTPASNDTTDEATIIDTEYYTITVPPSWNDNCFYKIVNGANYDYTLTFYEKASYEDMNGGRLFSIKLIPESEDYSKYPEYEFLGSVDVYRIGSYNVIVTYPSDVQFSEKTAKSYNEMSSLIPDILDTISFKEGCTFSENSTTNKDYNETQLTSRANGNWSRSTSISESQNLIIRSDGTFILSYNSFGEVKEIITGTYKIVADDGQYQQFVFYSSNDSWNAKIFQTKLTDKYGVKYDGIEYISENGDILYYTGIKFSD